MLGPSTPPYLLRAQDAQQAVQQDLQPDGNRLGSVQDQGAQVKDAAGQSHLHLPVRAELLQGWRAEVDPSAETMETDVMTDTDGWCATHTHTHARRKP